MTIKHRLPIFCVILGVSLTVDAELTLDGTLGAAGAITPNNNTYTVDSTLGKLVGSNLFHSFGRFNLETGATLNFTDASQSAIANVIARVTGGQPSDIDGTIRSSIPNADLYLINPAGLLFGPNAKLDVPGSFHASTAANMIFRDGGRFDAVQTGNDILTSAPPQAFGFLEAGSGGIEIRGGRLWVNNGKTLDVTAGNINLDDSGILYAPEGEIRLVAMRGEGEVGLQKNADGALPLPEQAPTLSQAGDITLRGNSASDYGGLVTSGDGGGRIAVWGGDVRLKDGVIFTVNEGGKDANASQGVEMRSSALSVDDVWIGVGNGGQGRGGDVRVDAAGALELVNGSRIVNTNLGAGATGNITVKAGDLKIDRQANANATGILSYVYGTGNAGNIQVESTGNMDIVNGGQIFSASLGDGNAAGIKVKADNLHIDRQASPDATGIVSLTSNPGTGRAGAVDVEARGLLQVDHGALITSSTLNASDSADVTIAAGELNLQGRDSEDNGSSIFTWVDVGSLGQAGHIGINVRNNLEILGGANISSFTLGSGKSGDLSIKSGNLTIDGTDAPLKTGIYSFSQPDSLGASGGVSVASDGAVNLLNGGSIFTSTASSGNAGNISLTAAGLTIALQGASNNQRMGIYSDSLGAFSGSGGSIKVATAGEITIAAGEISTNTYGAGNAGTIVLNSDVLRIDGQNRVVAGINSSSFGSGNAGNIGITSNEVSLARSGYIATDAASSGQAGAIAVGAKHLDITDGGEISSSSLSSGKAGNVAIHGITPDSAAERVVIDGVSDDSLIPLPDGSIVRGLASGIYLNALGSGNGGSLDLKADRLVISDGGLISAIAAFGSRLDTQGGNIDIHAGTVELSGGALISANTSGIGKAGSVSVAADESLTITGAFDRIRHADFTNRRTSEHSGISSGASYNVDSNAKALGKGGSVTISASTLTLADGGEVSAVNQGSDAAGAITISAREALILNNDSAVSVESALGNAGDIGIQAGRLVYLQNSRITTSAAEGFGNGGNINIDPTFVVLNNSQIIANAVRGNGGNINITTDFFLPSTDSLVSAASSFGLQGTVSIQSQSSNIAGSIGVLPGSLLDVSNLLNDDCSAAAANASSFTVGGKGGLPLAPDGLTFQGLRSLQCGVGL